MYTPLRHGQIRPIMAASGIETLTTRVDKIHTYHIAKYCQMND